MIVSILRARARLNWAILFSLTGLLAACASTSAPTLPPPPQVSPTLPAVAATISGVDSTAAPAPTYAPPLQKPSAAAGAAVYADACQACHGTTGKGDDGTMSPQLPGPVPDFSSPAYARSISPADWFNQITVGTMDKFMPPWGDRLSAEERWNVVAYLLTLSTPVEQIAVGQKVYAANCARCHGVSGQGDGPDAAQLSKPPLNFSDPDGLAQRSQKELFASVTSGQPPMPAFAATLSEADRWAVLDYARAFAYTYASPQVVTASASTGRISGVVRNGTANASVPTGLAVTLHGFDKSGADLSEAFTLSTTVGLSGTYQFETVSNAVGRQFVVSTQYQTLIYGSNPAAFAAGQNALDLPLTIYETTADVAKVRVERMHLFLEFSSGQISVGELFVVANDGDRTISNTTGTLVFPLPADIQGLQVQGETEGVDYLRTPQGLVELSPIRPGPSAAQILVYFQLPYTAQLDLEQTLPYPVAVVNVLVSDPAVKLLNSDFQDQGLQSSQGQSFRIYTAQDWPAGKMLTLQLSGVPGTASATPAPVDNTQSILVGALGLTLALAGIAGYWWTSRRAAAAPALPADRDGLLQAIADLDDAYENGDMDEAAYTRRREKLKDRLLALTERDD